ncbi:helicase family member protein [Theileria equi strain WA]|uniref:Helicase family member protein n=1 Tax=Theileria equi strain WA TaxID=1537102 RepID=L0B0F0_THEEQ|nr:helicase family member protein [Theileria equi strain WA]AFZ81295.1 helicase family member protein [Theileria equi strain WA]|eukprot:XP_004830961.1 helicase family member protein [Theileria equi strain WA]
MAPRRGWCKYCHDDYRPGDIIIRCITCPKTFHKECLEQDILTNSLLNANIVDDETGKLDLSNFRCENCLQYADSNEIVNDERCKLCKEKNRDSSDILLLCDGCPNSYHMSCLELQVEPDSDKWYCPMCRPDNFKGINVRKSRRNPLTDSSDHVNSSICYVCQRHGKLLGCDFCSNAFHHDCLPEFDVGTIGDVWECPCCKGEDPFLNQMHKRWTIQQIEKNVKTRKKCISYWKNQISRYRTRFLLAHKRELEPFVTDKVMQSLLRTFNIHGGGKRTKGTRSIEVQLESLEEEEFAESNKFIIKAHKSAYYPSGRKMESKPLRAGVTLKPHQEDGVDWLLKSFLTGGAILSDEMGLGKTIQTLCFLSYLKLMNIEGPHLIVVPLSTVGNWLREVHRFTPHLTFIKICGSRTERLHAMEDRLAYNGLYDLYITTYETVKSEEPFFVETVSRWQCLVLDEAHRIKNQSGAARHSMDRISANMRLLLTGTPLQNNATELFTLINFMFPDMFKDSAIIEEAFTNAQKKGQTDDSIMDGSFNREDLESIKLLLGRVMLRRLKEQAITLPRKIFHDVWLPLSKVSLSWYRTLMNVRSLMQENVSIKKLLGLVIKMRIVCGHPRGIVSRSTQAEKLFEFFKQEELRRQSEVEMQAEKLKEMKGNEHITASAKLTFLDKLLQQLHYENCTRVPGYSKLFNNHLKELDTSAKHKKKFKKKMNKNVSTGQTDGNADLSTDAGETLVSEDNTKEDNPPTIDTFIRTPRSTAKDSLYLSDGLFETPLVNECPYVSLKIFEKAQDEENKRKTDSNITVVPEEFISSARKNDRKIIDSDDDFDVPKNEEISIKTEVTEPQIKSEDDLVIKEESLPESGIKTEHSNVNRKPMMHKVLVFTQFQLVLDELEAYCCSRGWKYMRLDGTTNKLIRELDIREFNAPESLYFVYLISTRAGGLGINLTAANHVVLYDEDWNPFIDLQAIDRAHRIGQKRDVHVWKLISEWTVEERMALRREQKLHLDKLLINSNHEIDYEDISETPIMTLSPAAILKMMMHGNKALKYMNCEEIIELPLDDIVSRGRRKPPMEFDDAMDDDFINDDGADAFIDEICDDDENIDVNEVMLQEDYIQPIEAQTSLENNDSIDETEQPSESNNLESSFTDLNMDGKDLSMLIDASGRLSVNKRVKRMYPNKEDRTEMLKQLESAGLLWRSGRERKPPSTMYVPESWRKKTEVRQFRHEVRCFCCGFGKGHKANYKDKNGETAEVEYGELIQCFRCPKSYHKFCERLPDDTRKTWTCRWHECCLCFRKSSQCGNLLIHCSNCPTSFCYDCFPPDYTRHYVGEDYYHSLNQRGMNANSHNWIFFLCSKCKIQQEKEKRKKLTGEEKEARQRLQKELRSQIMNDLERKRMRTKDGRKSTIEALKGADMELENRMRELYEGLFPPNLLSEIKQRIEDAKVKKEANDKAGIAKTKREVSFLNTKLPSKLLTICDNCKIPFHNTFKYPGQCPFPKECIKIDFNINCHKKSSVNQEDSAMSTDDIGQHDETSDISNKDETNPSVVSSSPELKSTSSEKGKTEMYVKTIKKTACSKCQVVQTGKFIHYRRHCDLLTAEELSEYTERRKKVESALEMVSKASVKTPNSIDYSTFTNTKLKITYNQVIDECDIVFGDLLIKAGIPIKSINRLTVKEFQANKQNLIHPTSTNLQSYISNANVSTGSSQPVLLVPPLKLSPLKEDDNSNEFTIPKIKNINGE